MVSVIDNYFKKEEILKNIFVFDDGLIKEFCVDHLWALEKNTRAVSFYSRHGFRLTGQKRFEEDTTEYLVELKR